MNGKKIFTKNKIRQYLAREGVVGEDKEQEMLQEIKEVA